MKGDYAGAAKRLAQDNSKAVIAAVDATVEQSLGNTYKIKGYPTLKYFYKGSPYEDYNGGRRKMDFVEFMKKKINAGHKDELWKNWKLLNLLLFLWKTKNLKSVWSVMKWSWNTNVFMWNNTIDNYI